MIAKGNLVYLRLPELGDEEIMLTWENDELLWSVSDTTEKFSLQDIENFVKSDHNIYTQNQLRLMICETTSERQVGCIDLFEFDDYHKRAGVGILIYDMSDKLKGFASQALNLLAIYCREELQLKQLFCNVLTDNKASIKLFEKNDFVTVGEKRDWRRIGEIWKNEFIMQRILS